MSELTTKSGADAIEAVIAQGDLSNLSAIQRVDYYIGVCKSLELNPSTRPFEYITLNGKLTLYATRGATDQLRQSRHIGLIITSRERIDDIYIVTARATMGERTDESIGAVSIRGLQAEALANAMMKAETKAKRRVTLSISGLGWSDETEVDSIPNAKPVTVDVETGEIQQPKPAPEQPAQSSGAVWTRDIAAVKRVTNFAFGGNGLSESELHEAFGGKLHDYPGSEKQAIEAIKSYIHRKATPPTPPVKDLE